MQMSIYANYRMDIEELTGKDIGDQGPLSSPLQKRLLKPQIDGIGSIDYNW